MDAAWQDFRISIRRRRTIRTIYYAAAFFILPALLIWGVKDDISSETETINVCEGGSVVLCDGTRVALSADSRLFYPEKFASDGRKVRLDGTAYFEVTSSPENPFYIDAAGGYIKVTGTKFLATATQNNSLKVNLDEGKVELGAEGVEPVHIYPSEEVEFSTLTGEVLESDLAFKDETLENVLEKISTIYGFKCVFANDSQKDSRLLFRIPKYEKPEKIISLIETVCDIKTVYADGVLTIF